MNRMPLQLGVGALLLGWSLCVVAQPPRLPAIVDLAMADADGKPMAVVTGDDNHMKVLSGEGKRAVEVSRYRSSDKLLEASVKRYEQVTLALKDWPIDELMHFVSGRVQITDGTGHAQIYGPGDTIVMPRGFTGEWKQLGTIEMVTLTYGTWQ